MIGQFERVEQPSPTGFEKAKPPVREGRKNLSKRFKPVEKESQTK